MFGPITENTGGGGVTDHGALTGLSDDDHSQYLLGDGTRALTGDIDMDTNNIINTGYVQDPSVTLVTTTKTLTQNTETRVLADSSSGAYTITLPALSGQKQEIEITKTTVDYNKITVATAGSDKIDNPFAPVAIPTGTSISLIIPGDSVRLISDGTYWRVTNYQTSNNVAVKVTFSGNVATNTSLTKAPYDTIDANINYGGYYDAVTNYRFTPLVEGIYKITNNLDASGAGLSTVIAYAYKNGAALSRTATPIDDATQTTGGTTHSTLVYCNGSTDYLEAYYWTPNAAKTLNASFCYVSYELQKRLS